MVSETRHAPMRPEGRELLEVLSSIGGSDVRDSIEALIADPCSVVLVGEFDGVAAGFAIARRLEDPAGGAPLAVVVAMFVDPGLRRVGVGEAMVEQLEAWAVARGSRGLDVMALPGSRDAKSLLEARGYKARALVMYRRLDAGS